MEFQLMYNTALCLLMHVLASQVLVHFNVLRYLVYYRVSSM